MRKPNPFLGTEEDNGLKINPFLFLQQNSAKLVPIMAYLARHMKKNVLYRDVRLVTGKRKYIEYYYRIPEALRSSYKNKIWERIRVFEGINRYKDPQWPQQLLEGTIAALEMGYNPFQQQLDALNKPAPATALPTPVMPQPAPVSPAPIMLSQPMSGNVLRGDISLLKAIDNYEADCKRRNLKPKTLSSYGTLNNFMKEYFAGNTIDRTSLLFQPLGMITDADMEKFLQDCQDEYEWGGKTYNNYLEFARAFFNWCIKKPQRYILQNPVADLSSQIEDGNTHTAYTDQQAADMKKALLKDKTHGTYLYEICQFTYYTAMRNKSESRIIQLQHLDLKRQLIQIPGSISKNRKSQFIPMCDDLCHYLTEKNIKKYPANYYLFGMEGQPAPEPTYANYFASIYKPFKDALGLPDHTIYGWKHTRAIHLAQDGVNPYEIQKLFRHHSLEQTMTYLRDLGANISRVASDKSRKF